MKMSPTHSTKKLGSGYFVVWIIYAAIIIPTAYYGIVALLPCESNFEGACGMGKALKQLCTLFAAVVLSVIGWSLSFFYTSGNMSRLIAKAAMYLPVTYFCSVVCFWTIGFLNLVTILIVLFVLYVMFLYKQK